MNLDSRVLRDALGQFATGVCLVSVTDAELGPQALTVNSFASVSLEPPLVLWSLQKTSDMYRVYATAREYSIAVLSVAQTAQSSRYAQRGQHALQPGDFSLGTNGSPIIEGALVNLECTLEQGLDGGDHTILLGRVTRIVHGAHDEPLIFFGGDYKELR